MVGNAEVLFAILAYGCFHLQRAIAAHSTKDSAGGLVWTENKLTTAGATDLFRSFLRHRRFTFTAFLSATLSFSRKIGSQPVSGLAGCYFFFLPVWARSEAIGPRSCLGVFGLRRSLPACDAVFFDVAIPKQYDSFLLFVNSCGILLAMGANTIPPLFTCETDPDLILAALEPLLFAVYEAFEVAVPEVELLIEREGIERTVAIFNHLVRCKSKVRLRSFDCQDEDNGATPLQIEQVMLDGLALEYRGLRFRILKGAVLPAAQSIQRQRFYQQELPIWSSDMPAPTLRTLVILWDINSIWQFSHLYLVAPKSGDARTAEAYWQCEIKHPAESIAPPPSGQAGPDIGDLDNVRPLSVPLVVGKGE